MLWQHAFVCFCQMREIVAQFLVYEGVPAATSREQQHVAGSVEEVNADRVRVLVDFLDVVLDED